jgi:hypothetical protein
VKSSHRHSRLHVCSCSDRPCQQLPSRHSTSMERGGYRHHGRNRVAWRGATGPGGDKRNGKARLGLADGRLSRGGTRGGLSPTAPRTIAVVLRVGGRSRVFFLFYSSDMWILDVIWMVEIRNCTKRFFGSQIHSGAAPWWIRRRLTCIHGYSVEYPLFLQELYIVYLKYTC